MCETYSLFPWYGNLELHRWIHKSKKLLIISQGEACLIAPEGVPIVTFSDALGSQQASLLDDLGQSIFPHECLAFMIEILISLWNCTPASPCLLISLVYQLCQVVFMPVWAIQQTFVLFGQIRASLPVLWRLCWIDTKHDFEFSILIFWLQF